MTMVNKDSQSAIEQKEKAHYTHFYCGCVPSFISVYLNLAIGSSKIQFNDILSYVTGHTNTKATFLIHNVRMPRMLAGLIIGGALAIAGLLMQAIAKSFGFTTDFWCECRCFLRYCTYNCTYTITRLLLYNFSDNWCLLRRFYCLYIVWLY